MHSVLFLNASRSLTRTSGGCTGPGLEPDGTSNDTELEKLKKRLQIVLIVLFLERTIGASHFGISKLSRESSRVSEAVPCSRWY
jgi:hypothetical protein